MALTQVTPPTKPAVEPFPAATNPDNPSVPSDDDSSSSDDDPSDSDNKGDNSSRRSRRSRLARRSRKRNPRKQRDDGPSDPSDDDPSDPDDSDNNSSSSSSNNSSSVRGFKVATTHRRDRRAKLTDPTVQGKDLTTFSKIVGSVKLIFKGIACTNAFIDQVVDAATSGFSTILQLPNDLEEANKMVKGWIVQPDTRPDCAEAFTSLIADLVRRSEPYASDTPMAKKRVIALEHRDMLDVAFPTDQRQQRGWEALTRIHNAYARIARSIQPTIVEALRGTPIPSEEVSAHPLLTWTAMLNEYGRMAFRDISDSHAQDTLCSLAIQALADDPRFTAHVPNWYAQIDANIDIEGTVAPQSFDKLCHILRTFGRLMSTRAIQARTTSRLRKSYDRSEPRRESRPTYYGNQRGQHTNSPKPRDARQHERRATVSATQRAQRQARIDRQKDRADIAFLGAQVADKPSTGPWCGRCNAAHTIHECPTVICRRCNTAGHIAKSCTATVATVGPQQQPPPQQRDKPVKQSKPRRIDNDEHRSYMANVDASNDEWTYLGALRPLVSKTGRQRSGRRRSPARQQDATNQRPVLYLDTCSTQDVTGCRSALHDIRNIKTERAYGFGITEISHAGSAHLVLATDDGTLHNIHLSVVKYAPTLGPEVFILSVRRLVAKGYAFDLDCDSPRLTTPDGRTVRLSWRNNLLAVDPAELTMLGSSDRVATTHPSVWHGRLSHLSHPTMRRIAQSCTGIPTLPPQDPEPCIACVKAKMQHRAISKSPDTPPHPTSPYED